jgi:hypothetical protein
VDNLTGTFTADPSGLAFATIPSSVSAAASSAGSIWSSTFSGTVSMLYAMPSDVLPGQVASDAQNVYFSVGGFGSDAGLYSVARGGGSATPLVMRSGGLLSGLDVDAFTLDANNVYVTLTDTSTTPPTGSIYSMPKGSTSPTKIYTAPGGLTIDDVFVDGSTLWWTEGDVLDMQPTTIRSAPIATSLSSTVFATIQPPLLVDQMVEAGGMVAFVYFTISLSSDGGAGLAHGVYTVTEGGTPVLADSGGILPIAIGPAGDVYYPSFPGISKITIGSGGPSAPTTAVPRVGALGVAVDSSGTLYYATTNCIDKL